MLLAVMVTACDNTTTFSEETEPVLPVLTNDDVMAISAEEVVGKSGETNYRLEVAIRASRNRHRIRGLQLLSDSTSFLLLDDGANHDRKRRDGVYSGLVPAGCIPVAAADHARNSTGKGIDLECKIYFVGPGEKCGSWTECPSRVRRSLLFGLIEYETDIVVCFCIDECTFSLNSD